MPDPDINKVLLLGRAGQDAVLGENRGRPVANFSLATHRNFRSSEGEWERRTSWSQVAVFGPLAESAARHIKKGLRVHVEGRLDHQDLTVGDRRLQTSRVIAESFKVGSRPGDQPEASEAVEDEPSDSACSDLS